MNQRIPVAIFAVLTFVYVCFVMSTPADPSVLAKYGIDQSQARLLNLTVVVPLLVIWTTALYGYLRFKTYASLVTGSTEGRSLNQLADGLMVLALSLPATSAITSVLTYIALQDPSLVATTTIIKNYVGVGLSLVAFIMIANGARGLVKTSRRTIKQTITSRWAALLLIVLSVVYTWCMVAQPFGGPVKTNIYFLPEWLVVITLTIPYLFAWYQGIVATYFVGLYKDKVRGRVYKDAFNNLALGIGVIVGVSILIRFITTLTSQLNRLDLTPMLTIVYILVLGYALGFWLVARGSKKLTKIEEV